MSHWMLIALAGALGSVLRHAISLLAQGFTKLPAGTWLVNVLGCFILAFVAALTARGLRLDEGLWLALTVGFCGGLTTYSTFNQELFIALHTRPLWALTYLGVMLLSCLLAAGAALLAARAFT